MLQPFLLFTVKTQELKELSVRSFSCVFLLVFSQALPHAKDKKLSSSLYYIISFSRDKEIKVANVIKMTSSLDGFDFHTSSFKKADPNTATMTFAR